MCIVSFTNQTNVEAYTTYREERIVYMGKVGCFAWISQVFKTMLSRVFICLSAPPGLIVLLIYRFGICSKGREGGGGGSTGAVTLSER